MLINTPKRKSIKIIGTPKEWVDKFGVKAKKNMNYADAYNKLKKIKKKK